MGWTRLALVGLVVALAAGLVVGPGLDGLATAEGDRIGTAGQSDGDTTSTPTVSAATPTSTPASTASTPSGDATTPTADSTSTPTATQGPAFDSEIESIERCGTTCRDVTATLTNTGGAPAENVVVETNVYADDRLLWEGRTDVGTLAAGESYTETRRIELGYADAYAVEQNDGWVTIETIVRFDGGTMTLTERRQVT